MSLGIFYFDLEAFINSFSQLIENAETEPVVGDPTLEKIEETLQNLAESDSKFDDVLMATALKNTVTSVLKSETTKKESPKPALPAPTSVLPPLRLAAPGEEKRQEIERLLKSLQTSVIHNYRDADIAAEEVSLKTVTNFPKGQILREKDDKSDKTLDERKREELKLEKLREELKRARLRSESGV